AHKAAEDHEIKRGGHRRGHQRLRPDTHDAPIFADEDGAETRGADARQRQHLRAHGPRFSTSRMNSSSRRFTLLRIEMTSMPASERREKISLRFCSFEVSISSVWSSTIFTVA